MDEDTNIDQIEETNEPKVPVEVGGADILINLEGMIKNHISSIERIEEEHKKLKDMLEDIFLNDTTYQEHAKEAKDAVQKKSKTKSEVLKRPQAHELNEKVKGLKSEMSELQGALSDYLQEFQRMSGLDTIETDDGKVRQIVYIAKLIKKS